MSEKCVIVGNLLGAEIVKNEETGLYRVTDIVKVCNRLRLLNNIGIFNLSQYLYRKTCSGFIKELERKYGNIIMVSQGSLGGTWVHPLIFIDIVLEINVNIKIEEYEWIYDNLKKFRNDSGDSYREMSASLYSRYGNAREFPNFIKDVEKQIQIACGVADWQSASDEQLKQRHEMYASIKLFCNVLIDANSAVRLGIHENINRKIN